MTITSDEEDSDDVASGAGEDDRREVLASISFVRMEYRAEGRINASVLVERNAIIRQKRTSHIADDSFAVHPLSMLLCHVILFLIVVDS